MKMAPRTIGRMCVCTGKTNNMISSNSLLPSTWKLIPIFILVLLTLSFPCTNGENSEVEPFTASKVLSEGGGNARSSPGGKSVYKCDPPTMRNGKPVVNCRGYNTIPTDIPEKHEVKELDMSGGNHLQKLTDGQLSLADLPMLTSLNLQNCQIHVIERGAFKGGNVLVELDLSKNRIEVLDPDVFSGLQYLRHLKIRENPINRFQMDAVFPPLQSLELLDMSGCSLDSVPVNIFSNLKVLGTLNLNRNKLGRLDWRVFKQTWALRNLDLSNNPWVCDCHVKFLIETLKANQLSTQATCGSVPSTASVSTTRKNLAGMKWDSIPEDALVCKPEISKFDRIDNNNDDELGKDIYFECEYSGYERPQISFFKDNKPILIPDESARGVQMATPGLSPVDANNENMNNSNPDNLHDSSSSAGSQLKQKPKYEIQDGTYKVHAKNMDDEDERRKNYKFVKHLILRRVKAEDKGEYECHVRNSAGYDLKSVFLNLTTIEEDGLFLGGVGGKKKVALWMWLLVGLLIALILVLLVLLVCLAWRRKEKRKQEGFRKVIQDKFKDSNVDLGDLVNMKTTSPNQQQKSPDRSEGTVPLLDNGSEHSTVLITDAHQKSQLPDVAMGNAKLLRNSQIFSPKPPPATLGYPAPSDARREFFARQISEPYMRPASAMSLTRPSALDASQRRYVFANQHYPTAPGEVSDQEHQYAVPDHVRTLPRLGTAMSMSALAENDLRRQMFLRQYPQPQQQHYGTAMRPHPQFRRTPSTSSESQVDNTMVGAFNYSTLPRRPIRLQSWSRPVSPTGSTCSSYSTLSWRPMANPITGTVSDGVGPRRDALGGSSASLSQTPELTGSIIGGNGDGLASMNRAMVTPTIPGKVKNIARNHPRLGHSRTPSSLTRGHNDFFSFEPIQEVESSASNLNLENNGRQTPSEYATQSLARGEPKYKKKKPPPIAFNPANLREPSRVFDHLKGRSVSPAANRNDQVASNAGNNPSSRDAINNEVNANNAYDILSDISRHMQSPILESPIDEIIIQTAAKEESSQAPPNNRLSKSGLVPPPPPPKPKRGHNAEEGENDQVLNNQNNLNKISESEIQVSMNDGTVV